MTVVAVLVVLAAAAGCSDDGGGDSPASRPAPDSATSVPREGDFAGLVDIGGGRDLYLECRGTGSPTVVLVSGAGVAADNWGYAGSATDEANPAQRDDSAVYPAVAKLTRVCAYDRPGTQQWDGEPSRSTTVPQPTTTQGDAADLRALLTEADVTGPYVIVGHSLGGLIATSYARMYPEDVTGLVLVDPGSEYLRTVLPPAVWTQWVQTIATTGEEAPDAESPDYPASIAALEATAPLEEMPVAVLTSDQPFDYLGIDDAETYWPEWIEAQTLLATSLNATHIKDTASGHFVAVENSAAVIDQICAVATPDEDC